MHQRGRDPVTGAAAIRSGCFYWKRMRLSSRRLVLRVGLLGSPSRYFVLGSPLLLSPPQVVAQRFCQPFLLCRPLGPLGRGQIGSISHLLMQRDYDEPVKRAIPQCEAWRGGRESSRLPAWPSIRPNDRDGCVAMRPPRPGSTRQCCGRRGALLRMPRARPGKPCHLSNQSRTLAKPWDAPCEFPAGAGVQ